MSKSGFFVDYSNLLNKFYGRKFGKDKYRKNSLFDTHIKSFVKLREVT